MQVAERAVVQLAHRMLAHFREEHVAHLIEHDHHDPTEGVNGDHCRDREAGAGHHGARRYTAVGDVGQAVGRLLERDRYRDGHQLGQHQHNEREHDAAAQIRPAFRPDKRQQTQKHRPVAGASRVRRPVGGHRHVKWRGLSVCRPNSPHVVSLCFIVCRVDRSHPRRLARTDDIPMPLSAMRWRRDRHARPDRVTRHPIEDDTSTAAAGANAHRARPASDASRPKRRPAVAGCCHAAKPARWVRRSSQASPMTSPMALRTANRPPRVITSARDAKALTGINQVRVADPAAVGAIDAMIAYATPVVTPGNAPQRIAAFDHIATPTTGVAAGTAAP